MASDDFDFVDKVFCEVAYRSDRDGWPRLSRPEQVVLLSWGTSGIIGNGGFRYLFETSLDVVEVAHAFDDLGLTAAGDACRASLAFFPHSIPPSDHAERQELIDADEARADAIWEPLSRIIWQHDEALEQRLAAFIRENRAAFAGYRAIP